MTDVSNNQTETKPFLTQSTGDKSGVSPREGVAPVVEPERPTKDDRCGACGHRRSSHEGCHVLDCKGCDGFVEPEQPTCTECGGTGVYKGMNSRQWPCHRCQSKTTNLAKRFDIRDRQTGKTTDLLAWMRDAPEGEHRIYVGASNESAMHVYRSTFVDGVSDLESWQFVGMREVSRDAWGGVLRGRGGVIVLGLDNLDLMLNDLFGWPVGRVTINEQ